MTVAKQTSGRPRLIDLDMILEAALELGVDNLSMHAVARRLGVSVAALYRHVNSREALLDACIDAFCARIEMPSTNLAWSEHLHATGLAFRKALLAMPGMSAYGMKIGPTTPAAFTIIDSSLAVLLQAGFEPAEAWDAFSIVVDHAFFNVQLQENYASGKQADEADGYKILRLQDDELSAYPNLKHVFQVTMSEPGFPHFDRSYERQLSWLINGIAARRTAKG